MPLKLNPISHDQLKSIPVFGIAGNFADHLSQAGEDADFVNIKTEEPDAPKGIFSIYLPNEEGYLGTYPLSHSEIQADFDQPINLQMEPEMCVLFEVTYEENYIFDMQPKAFSAFNDCSIRKPNAKKISEKKNWGIKCAGLSENWLPITNFSADGDLSHFHITSYLRRDGEVIQYGMDSPVASYQYFYEKLLKWMVKTLNSQIDFGPLENLNAQLKKLNNPEQIIISLGATRYTEFGETGFLKPADEVAVFIYDERECSETDTLQFFSQAKSASSFKAGCLLQQQIKAR